MLWASRLQERGTSQQTALTCTGKSKKTYREELPDFGRCLSQSINQAEMSDISSEGPIRFDRVDNLCL